MRRALAAAGLALAAVFLLAAPASAHAELRSTEPPSGAVLDRAPARMVLRFTESVEVSLGAVRVFDVQGARIDTGPARHADGRRDAVAVELPDLRDGAYVVTWRVISADSHPVHGAFSFRVGVAPAGGAGADSDTGIAERLLADEGGGSRAVGVVYGVGRFGAFASVIVLVGGALFLIVLWPGGALVPRARRLLAGAWTASVVTTAAAIPLQGVYGGGLPLGDSFRWSLVSGVIDTRFGRSWLIRVVAILVAGPLLAMAVRALPKRLPGVNTTLVLAAAVVLVTPGIAGHPGADHPVPLTVSIDALHLGAVSFWLGGMAMLLFALLPRGHAGDVDTVVPRYSRLAFGAVVVILATGLFQGWRQTRSIDAATDTTYGRLLLVKFAIFTGMVALAGLSRAWVRRRVLVRGPTAAVAPGAMVAGAPPVRRLKQSVGAEALLAVAVLVVTSLLVNTVPARSSLTKPFSTELRAGRLLVDITVDPAKAGPVDVHVYTLSPAGEVTEVEELTVRLTLPDRDIGPIEVPLQRAGPGHFAAYRYDIPIAGTWRMDVTARLTDIDAVSASTTIPIR